MPGTDPFLTYAEDTSSKVDMAQNIEKGVNDRSVFDQQYYTGKDKVTPPEAQPPAMPPAVAAPLPGSSEYRANPFLGQGPEISTITRNPIKKWGIAAQEMVPSHEVYTPPAEPWDQIALKTWKGIGLQAEKLAAGTVRAASDLVDTVAPDSSTPESRFAMDTEAQALNREIAANAPGEGSTWAQRQAFGLGQSLPTLVAAVGGGIVTKAPGFAGYLMGFTSGVEKYSDLKDYGYDTGKAAIVASLYGSADAIFFGKAAGEWQAMLTAGKAATPTLERTAVDRVAGWAGDAFKKYGVVIGAMELDTAAKSVVNKLSDQPNMTAQDFAESMFDTLVQGTAIHAGMTAAGAAAGLARKTDFGPTSFQGWVAREFPKMPFAETDYGGNVTLPDGRTLEIHTPFSPAAEKLMAEGLAGGDQSVASEIKAGERVVSGMYFKVGDTTITNNDLIFLTGQGTDPTTLGHEKGHLVMSAVNMLATPEELKAVGLDAKATDQEKVIGGKYEEYLVQRQASPENPKSPLDKLFARVADFAHEAYSAMQGSPTERAVFERIRSGKMLERAGATPEQAAKMAERGTQYQVKDGNVATAAGEFPLDHNGWKFEGEWPGTGMYQYSKVLPDSPIKATLYVKDPSQLEARAALKEKEFAGPKMQTRERTPGPKGLTVNFTSPEVTALGEEMLRGAFEKLQYTQTNDQTTKKAQDLLASGKVSLDTFLNHDPYTAWPDSAHQVAAEAIAGGVFDYVKERIADFKAGKITADEANQARMVGMASIASWYLPQSEVGRMLQARQISVSPEGIPIRDLMAEQMKFETDLQELKNRGLVTDDQVLDAMGKFYSIDQAQNFVSRVAKAKVKEPSVLNQLFYFSLLSNPVTHAANVIGNIGPLFIGIAEQALAEKMPFSSTPKGGAAGMAAGLIHTIFDAYTLFKRTAYTGEAMFGQGKVEGGPARTGVESIDQARSALDQIHNDPTHPYHDPSSPEYDAAKRDVMLLHRKAYNPISGDRLSRLIGDMDASGFFPRMADVMGEMIDAPFKGLNAEDMAFKVLNQRMWIWKSAYEMGIQQGLEGDAFDKFVATFVEDPPPATMATANEFALKQTFNNDPGKIAEALVAITREYPIARFILPFVRVPSNIFRFALERTPFAPALRQVREDIKNGGIARDMALSKMAIGTSMMAGVATLAAAGLITGGGPSDPKQKKIWTDSGWQEYSVKIDGTYYSYKRLDPFAMPIGVAADLVEMARFAPDFGFDEAALVGALAFVRNFTSKTYMQGFSDFLTAITSGGEDTMMASATKYGKGLPRVLVPGGIAQVARVADPMKHQIDGWLDTLKSRIPGLSSTLEPNYNLKGDPITIGMYESLPGKGFGMVNPMLWSEDKNDPVWQEIRRNRVPVTMPARRLGGGTNPDNPQLDQGATAQKLTPEQYSWLVRMAGNGLKDPKTGRGAWDELTAIINGVDPVATFYGKPIYYAQKNDNGTPVFTDGPDGGKAMIIQKVIGRYREGAKKMLEGGEPFPELHNEYVAAQTQKKINRAPQIGGAR